MWEPVIAVLRQELSLSVAHAFEAMRVCHSPDEVLTYLDHP
jgi:hypothetical protein